MRIVNEKYKTISESEVDLTKGYLIESKAIREDAIPVNDIDKFAWCDDDYEEVQMYCLNKALPFEIPEDTKEKRLNTLEADIKEIKGLFRNLTKKLNIKEEII